MNKLLLNKWVFGLLVIFISSPIAYAQQGQQQQDPQQQQQGQQQQVQPLVLPARPTGPHPAQRYEIDAKRTGTDMNSADALPRSREFLRIDSTYYVGWLYEGAYKYNHAADYVGFKNAAIPLERALGVMERDYKRDLATRSPSLITYFPVFNRHIDYALIVTYLNQCYLNTDDPEKAFALLRRYNKWKFQREFFDAYNYMMWVVHRNRFYTHSKYSFLRNSLEENEQLAGAYLDSALRRIEINRRFNEHIFPPGYEKSERLSVYHYKSMLYSYALKIDSAEASFERLRNTVYFPHNNYATFKMICGDFREAASEYKMASMSDAGDKRLQEWAYYSSILTIYKGFPKLGELQMKEMIAAAGSTPGFGWYNIALARCLFYDGQIAESQRYADKAAEFKELHIGTTLGQSHYDFSIQLNKLMTKEVTWEMKRFENRNWWYNPAVLGSMAGITAERYLQEFVIINQFSQNPERDRVIYKLFSTESTVSWDEIWYLIHDFSTQFFLKRFEHEAASDPRKNVRKYFLLFVARLKIKEGDYTEAERILNTILRDPTIDPLYEKLFIARTYQALAEVADKKDNTAQAAEWLYRMYQVYPQLLPFSGLKMNLQLQVSGTPDEAFVARLKDCNINWTNGGIQAPRAYLSFSKQGNIKLVDYYVLDAGGNYIVPKQRFSYQSSGGGGMAMAYRLFGIGGSVVREGDE